jgi:hypothetical protein
VKSIVEIYVAKQGPTVHVDGTDWTSCMENVKNVC